jgi:hypothetical protein
LDKELLQQSQHHKEVSLVVLVLVLNLPQLKQEVILYLVLQLPQIPLVAPIAYLAVVQLIIPLNLLEDSLAHHKQQQTQELVVAYLALPSQLLQLSLVQVFLALPLNNNLHKMLVYLELVPPNNLKQGCLV